MMIGDLNGLEVQCILIGGGFDDIGDIMWNVLMIMICFLLNILSMIGYNKMLVIVMVILIVYKGVVVGVKVVVMMVFDLIMMLKLIVDVKDY